MMTSCDVIMTLVVLQGFEAKQHLAGRERSRAAQPFQLVELRGLGDRPGGY